MATYYANISVPGSGGDGSIGNPWAADTFKIKINNQLAAGSIVKVSGSCNWPDNTILSVQGIGRTAITLENATSAPWSVSAWIMNIYGACTIKNGIINIKDVNGMINALDTVTFYDTFINCTVVGSYIVTSGSIIFNGCTVIAGVVNNNLYDVTATDTVFDVTTFTTPFTNRLITNNCVFTGPLPLGTHTDEQANWVPPIWPAWNAPRSYFSSNILSVGISTPPQPGNPPYENYDAGLWESERQGIGAFDFETDPGAYFANIDLIGTGGDGTFRNPWWSDSFVAQANSLTTSDIIKVKGIFDHPGIAGITVSCNLKNWVDAPFRISSENISIAGIVRVKNCILRGRVGVSITSDAQCSNCYIEANVFTIGFGTSQGTAMGCTIFAPFFNGGAGSIAYLKDCVISSTVFGSMVGTQTLRCVFMSGVPAGSHTDYQEHWPSPSWPVWNGARELFNSKIFSTNIHYPPQPGTINYYTYEYGLWNSVRTGVGALDFVDEWTDITTRSMSFNAVAVGGTKVMAVGYNGTIEMLSF